MITVEEASRIILSNLFKPSVIEVSFQEANGKVLAEDAKADRDLPPFDRVTMDGIAVVHDVWKKGKREFQIEGTQAAGEPERTLRDSQNAIEVMTGAVLPKGTDTVIRYEDLHVDSPTVVVKNENIVHGQSIHFKGMDARKDQVLLRSGTLLSPAEIAVLASLGKSTIGVYSFPRTAIVSSGDELVNVDHQPLPHQIRRSNTFAIEAAMKSMGWHGQQFHMRDDKEELTTSLNQILSNHDLIILSGGVSKGKFDFIPEVLESLGVKKQFHQVSQRPGKPFWFGVSREGKTVFALPGNPVSTFMCFYKYIQPWIKKSLRLTEKTVFCVLASDFSFLPKLTCFLQVRVENEEGRLVAYPDAGGGSGDFVNLGKIDGFIELPAEKTNFKAGEVFPFIAFRR